MAGIKGKYFAFTGKVGNLTRDLLVQRLEAAGGFHTDVVTAGTDYLVQGDTGRHGTTKKASDAVIHGVEAVSDVVFMDWLYTSERQRRAAHKAHATMRKQKQPPAAADVEATRRALDGFEDLFDNPL